LILKAVDAVSSGFELASCFWMEIAGVFLMGTVPLFDGYYATAHGWLNTINTITHESQRHTDYRSILSNVSQREIFALNNGMFIS